jgi:proteasome lid subunit RPN8/RPN11
MKYPATVLLSGQALSDILHETAEHFATETGGVLLGAVEGNRWYVAEVLDPGPGATLTHSYFEYNHNYLTHLANKTARRYKTPLRLLGLWHRHPGSLDRFSGTDDRTNTLYVERCGGPVVSGLVNLDPDFRLTFYQVTFPPLHYTPVAYRVGDAFFPPGMLDRWDFNALGHRLNDRSRDHRGHLMPVGLATHRTETPSPTECRVSAPVESAVIVRDGLARVDEEPQRKSSSLWTGLGSFFGFFKGEPEVQLEFQPQTVRIIAQNREVAEHDPYRSPAVVPRGQGTVGARPFHGRETSPTTSDPSPTQIEALDMLETEMTTLQGLPHYTSSISMIPEGIHLMMTREGTDGQLPLSFGFVLTAEGGRRYVQSDRGPVIYTPGIILSELERLDRADVSTRREMDP